MKLTRLFVPVSLVLLAVLFACTGKSGGAELTKVTAQETMGLVANDFAVVVDVREADEVKNGMAAPARWMPTSKIEDDNAEWNKFVDQLPKNKQIVLYCQAGGRAKRAGEKLAAKGFKVSYFSGFDEWKHSGLPVKTLQ